MEPKTFTQPAITSPGPWRTIVLIWLLAGTLDAVAAIVVSQASPEAVFRFIASGAFGAGRAYSGGSFMILWGVIFHYFIAFSWTVLFFFMYPAVPLIRKNKYIAGLLYGVFVWIIMNRVVIPLSEITPGHFNLKSALKGMSILIAAIGLPIAILTHRYYLRKGIV